MGLKKPKDTPKGKIKSKPAKTARTTEALKKKLSSRKK